MNANSFRPMNHELDPFGEPRDHSNAWDSAAFERTQTETSGSGRKLDPTAELRDHANAWDVAAFAPARSK